MQALLYVNVSAAFATPIFLFFALLILIAIAFMRLAGQDTTLLEYILVTSASAGMFCFLTYVATSIYISERNY